MTCGHPLQIDDAPIQKIIIRPLTSSIRKSVSVPSQRALKHSSAANDPHSASPVIHVVKNPVAALGHTQHRLRNNHLNSLIRSSEAYPIYFARAKANGSFHTIRVLKLE